MYILFLINATTLQKKYFYYTMVKKILNCKALDIDTAKKQVKIAIAETESIDYDKDLIVPTAAVKSIKERGPEGSNEIWHLLDHTANSFSALSKFSEMGMYDKYIGGVSSYKDSFAWREVAWPLYEAGDFTQHSIGFNTVKSQKKDGYREIQEITLFEGSAVLWGANPHTPTLAVMKSLGIDPDKDDLPSQIERLIKGVKLGKYEDESHKSLIEIELERIKDRVLDVLKSTKPETKSTLPEDVRDAAIMFQAVDVFKQFNNILRS